MGESGFKDTSLLDEFLSSWHSAWLKTLFEEVLFCLSFQFGSFNFSFSELLASLLLSSELMAFLHSQHCLPNNPILQEASASARGRKLISASDLHPNKLKASIPSDPSALWAFSLMGLFAGTGNLAIAALKQASFSSSYNSAVPWSYLARWLCSERERERSSICKHPV